MKPDIKAVETDQDPLEEAEPAAPPTAFHGFAEKIGSRNLMIAIITMPLFFIGALVLIIAIAGIPEEDASGAAPDAGVALDDSVGVSPVAAAPPVSDVAPAPAQPLVSDVVQDVALPAPASIPAAVQGIPPGGVALDGDRLAVRVETADGPVVYIYDLKANEVVQTISFSRP